MIHFFYNVWIFLFLFGYELSFCWNLDLESVCFNFFYFFSQFIKFSCIHIFVCLDIWERKFKFGCDIGIKLLFCWVLNLRKCLSGYLCCGYEYFELWRVCVCVSNCAFDGFWFFFPLIYNFFETRFL